MKKNEWSTQKHWTLTVTEYSTMTLAQCFPKWDFNVVATKRLIWGFQAHFNSIEQVH